MLGWFKKKIKKDGEAPKDLGDDQQEKLDSHPGDSKIIKEDDSTVEVALVTKPETKEEQKTEPIPAIEPEIEPEIKPEIKQEIKHKEKEPSEQSSASFLRRLKKSLTKTRDNLVQKLDSAFLGKKHIDADLIDEIEEILITADLGVQTVQNLLEDARAQLKRKELAEPKVLFETLKKQIYQYLHEAEKPAELVMPADGPFVIMVLGVNGVGKTTTIGKLAYKFKKAGQNVLLVAADTFRAAAIDQLKIWAERIDVEIYAQSPGTDPSSVVYDAMDFAHKRNFDVIIIDTAGRLHTKVNLMEELKKIKRVMRKKCSAAPHEVMLVLDATTGQNAISQAREFNKAVDITGLVLTKLDGTAKGGIVVNISREFNIPIRFIGIGEKMEDLRDFDPQEFIEALFSK